MYKKAKASFSPKKTQIRDGQKNYLKLKFVYKKAKASFFSQKNPNQRWAKNYLKLKFVYESKGIIPSQKNPKQRWAKNYLKLKFVYKKAKASFAPKKTQIRDGQKIIWN